MFGFGVWEVILALLLILFFFGGRKIPELGRGLGSAIRNFRGQVGDGKQDEEDEEDETRDLPRPQSESPVAPSEPPPASPRPPSPPSGSPPTPPSSEEPRES